MKRTWMLALFVALAALGVAACGGDDDDDGGGETGQLGGTVRMWIMDNGPDPVGDTERIVAPFEEETGVDVEVELVGWDVQFDRIRNAAVSGQGPDLTQAGTTQVPFFATLGGFEDVSDVTEELGGESSYAPATWETTQVEGQDGTFAVPWFTEARAIYYRKDALQQAGVDPATAFSDWDSFRQTLEKLKSVKEIDGVPIKPFGNPGKLAADTVHHISAFVWNNGGAELSEDATESAIASPEAAEAVSFFADLIPAGLYDTSGLERDGVQVEETFKGGRLATWIGGPWVLASVPRKDDETWAPAARRNVGVAPLPPVESGDDAATFVGGSNLMLFKDSQNKEAARALAEFLSRDEVQTEYAGLMGMFPARVEAQEELGDTDANYRVFADAISSGRTYAPIAQWGPIEEAYKEKFGAILEMAAGQGGESYSPEAVQRTLETAAAEANNLLAQQPG
jgi:multiple sugar transport system substrate-binding protein